MAANLKILGACVALAVLAGCDTSQGIGRFIAGEPGKAGPDEFSIVPTKPLELPENLEELPEPTEDGTSRVDLKPQHDAVAALGGRPERLDSTSVNSGETALLRATNRNGTAAGIREQLAKEDAEFRRRNGPKFLERIFRTDTYLRDYEPQTLQARREAARLRRVGVRTPTVSPPK